MKKTNKTFIALTIIFSTISLVFLILFISFLSTSITYKTKLENTYMKGFYEMVDNVNNLEVDLSKTIATTSIDSQRTLLTSMYESSTLGVNNLNLLPININKLSKLNKLLNTTGGFVYSLLQENYKGNAISEDDMKQLNDIHTQVKELQYDLNQYISKMRYDYSIIDDIDFSNGDNSDFTAGVINTESAGKDVPTLIYDGPFSDSVINKEIKGLTNVEYTQEEIHEMLSDVFSEFPIRYIGATEGKFYTYNYVVEADTELYVSVTKKGGLILSITSFASDGDLRFSISDGITHAETFASDVGIENMYSVWHQKVGNILYVNLAPIIDHVIYYSDLIKVKVDLTNGIVIGWEATSFAYNHVDGRTFTSSIGLLDAEEFLSPLLEVTERNLTIIPDKFVGELSAYEFICTWKDYTYYIYIDSNTGKEVNILRVIDTNNGQLLE